MCLEVSNVHVMKDMNHIQGDHNNAGISMNVNLIYLIAMLALILMEGRLSVTCSNELYTCTHNNLRLLFVLVQVVLNFCMF